MTLTQETFAAALELAREIIGATMINPFDADSTVVFTIDGTGAITELGRGTDAYTSLEAVAVSPMEPTAEALGIFTTGWAAPIGPDGDVVPSESPDRQRVQLCTAIDRRFSCMSAVRFDGGRHEFIDETGQGALHDAMLLALVSRLRLEMVQQQAQ